MSRGKSASPNGDNMTNTEFKAQLEDRTQVFSANVLRLLLRLPKGPEFQNIRQQVSRSATSVGANYREANHAESYADFAHKLGIVSKEAAETEYWLRLLLDLTPDTPGIDEVWRESDELNRLFHKIRLSCENRDRNPAGTPTANS